MGMKVYRQFEDVKLRCVRASTFPPDIRGAFGKLIALLPGFEGRVFFGISYQSEKGEIIYQAAVLDPGMEKRNWPGCEEFILEKGDYLVEMVRNWREDSSSIGTAFRKLTQTEAVIRFPCVEWYRDNDVLCMVRLEHLL
jgi:hypothetical protein